MVGQVINGWAARSAMLALIAEDCPAHGALVEATKAVLATRAMLAPSDEAMKVDRNLVAVSVAPAMAASDHLGIFAEKAHQVVKTEADVTASSRSIFRRFRRLPPRSEPFGRRSGDPIVAEQLPPDLLKATRTASNLLQDQGHGKPTQRRKLAVAKLGDSSEEASGESAGLSGAAQGANCRPFAQPSSQAKPKPVSAS